MQYVKTSIFLTDLLLPPILGTESMNKQRLFLDPPCHNRYLQQIHSYEETVALDYTNDRGERHMRRTVIPSHRAVESADAKQLVVPCVQNVLRTNWVSLIRTLSRLGQTQVKPTSTALPQHTVPQSSEVLRYTF